MALPRTILVSIYLGLTDELVICPLKHPSQYSGFSLPSKLGCSGLAWHPNDHTKLAIARRNRCELLLWDVNECRLSTNTSLGGYVRVINSLDWSPVHPFLIATTSTDQFRAICVWDLRDMSRPVRAIESLFTLYYELNEVENLDHYIFNNQPKGIAFNARQQGPKFDHSNVPEQYISVQADHVRDFDWSPQNVNQMVTVNECSEMRLWDIENPSYPLKKVRFHEIKLKKVIYTPSGDHIIILPEQSHWSVHGISVWSSANLTQSHDLFQVIESHDNSNTNNSGITVNKTSTNGMQICQPRSTDSYILDMNWLICSSSNLPFSSSTMTDDHELTTNFILDNEMSTTNQNLEYCPKKNVHLLTWSMDNILRVYPIHFKSISLHDNEPLLNQANKQTRIIKEKSEDLLDDKLSTNFNPKTNQSKKFGNAPTSSLNKPKYKLEEMDLINRTAKLILFYCRRNHHHHYSLCSVTNTFRRRRHSSVMNNEGLDSLLLPSTTDLISQMEFSEHSNFWKAHHRNLSSTTDTEHTISNQTSNSNSAVSVDNEESTHLTNDPSNHSTFDNSHELENSTNNNTRNCEMPLAGSIILSIEFPDNYPLNGAIPEFHVLDCSPPLPPEVLDELRNVLYSTASELVSTSRGCVEPCIRNAVITLQTYPTLNNQIESNSKKLNLTNLSTTNYDMFNINMDKLNKPIIDTTASMKQKCHYTIGIPFPRTSGVHFTTNGLIVTFGLPESLSFIRNSLKLTSSDVNCQVELTNTTTNNNSNDIKKDWTPQSFSEYQKFIHRFSSTNREYNNDMKRSFQNCIGNIIDSFARFEVDCKEQQRQKHQPHEKQKCIHEVVDKNRLSFKMNTELNRNSINSTADDTEVKNSFESSHVTEQKWLNSISTTHPNSPDVQNPNEMFFSHFSMIYPSTIQIYDMSPLIWDRHLMYDYSLNTENLQQMCIHNLHAVYNTHRKDLIRFWQYALVMSISLGHTDHSHQVHQPLASQLIGRPLFDTWIRHFLRIHDVQSLAMLVLVLQSLNRINELKFDTFDGSNISLNKLENTTTSLSSVNNFLETYSLCHMNESEKTINLLGCNTVASSSLEQQASFTLDNSDETQSEFSLVFGQSNENMNGCPIEQLPPKELSINSICAYQSRFVHPKDLFSFDHYIYVYASIIYSLHEYILHARLLRSWSYNIRANSLSHVWPYVQTNALILLSCPDMRCSSNLVPKHSNGSLKSSQCTHCQWEVNLENHQSTTGPQKPQRLLICTVCRNSCKGLVLVCPLCSHGGHVHHVSTWFNSVGRNNLPRQCPFINWFLTIDTPVWVMLPGVYVAILDN
ncbi:hypothetical protein Smp_154620 [Schistosoma mansoni]|uniref:hypothetical protein n=1 Tax=Schistosoma mansoni TaxID=6183 RepID=UPI00022DC3CB|nr:hypothetical protein Smp_154620 [Schistosoma mansoni]|eukprot:XP_018648670.1 hypothetical protein Smp_154620 [Schistosoma mansoni]